MNPLKQLVKGIMSQVLPRDRWVTRGDPSVSKVSLTFDDGPHPLYTPRLLEELRRFQIPATFFVVGRAAQEHPELIRQILDEGHTLGTHSFTHSEPHLTSAACLLQEVEQSIGLIEDLTGFRPKLFRPPKGALTWSKIWCLWKQHQTIVLWNQDPRDYRADSFAGITPWIQGYTPRNGDIVLMHDTHPHCIGAIEQLVDRIQQNGLQGFSRIEAPAEWGVSPTRSKQCVHQETSGIDDRSPTSIVAVSGAKQV